MKKIFSFFIAVIVPLSFFCSCSNDDGELSESFYKTCFVKPYMDFPATKGDVEKYMRNNGYGSKSILSYDGKTLTYVGKGMTMRYSYTFEDGMLKSSCIVFTATCTLASAMNYLGDFKLIESTESGQTKLYKSQDLSALVYKGYFSDEWGLCYMIVIQQR